MQRLYQTSAINETREAVKLSEDHGVVATSRLLAVWILKSWAPILCAMGIRRIVAGNPLGNLIGSPASVEPLNWIGGGGGYDGSEMPAFY